MLSDFRDRLFQRVFKDEKRTTILFVVIGIFLILILINIIYLNLILLKDKRSDTFSKTTSIVASKNEISPTLIPTLFLTPTIIPTIVQGQSLINTVTAVKDYFISLGTGSTQAISWTDVPGVATQVDFGNYSNIKEIHFEASLLAPSANQSVSVRLYNVTDNHPVWYSNMIMSSGQTSQYLISNPISYDLGSKLYQVQMETQLGALATLVQARIHIILK